MAGLDTCSAHSHGHSDVLSEVQDFFFDFLSHLLVGNKGLSSENTNSASQDTVRIVDSCLKFFRVQKLKIVVSPAFLRLTVVVNSSPKIVERAEIFLKLEDGLVTSLFVVSQ